MLALTQAVLLAGARGADGFAESSRSCGLARAEETRPAHFPHRIWAVCDFEARTPDYGWFGPPETNNVPPYPGNRMALGVGAKPYRDFSALMTGANTDCWWTKWCCSMGDNAD